MRSCAVEARLCVRLGMADFPRTPLEPQRTLIYCPLAGKGIYGEKPAARKGQGCIPEKTLERKKVGRTLAVAQCAFAEKEKGNHSLMRKAEKRNKTEEK